MCRKAGGSFSPPFESVRVAEEGRGVMLKFIVGMLAFGLGLESARAEQLFVRVTTAQGVVGAWYNPVAELDET
jgi:hypothetical protein